jgi:hypothetical protein
MAPMRQPLSFDDVGSDGLLLAFFALATGFLTVALVVLAGGEGTLQPGDLLPYFQAHRLRYVASATVTLAWTLTAIAWVASLRSMLGPSRNALALAATLLATSGIALLGFGSFVAIGSFFALDSASSGIAARLQVPYQAAIWRSLGFLLSDPGLMLLGGGQALFAWLAVRTAVPRWLVVIGFIGGVAGLLTLAVYQTPVLALAQLASLAVCAFAGGVALIRSRAPQNVTR